MAFFLTGIRRIEFIHFFLLKADKNALDDFLSQNNMKHRKAVLHTDIAVLLGELKCASVTDAQYSDSH